MKLSKSVCVILLICGSVSLAPDDGDICGDLLNQIATDDSNFTLCALLGARPFIVCTDCYQRYAAAYTLFYNLMESRDNISKACSEELVSGDRVSIIQGDFDLMKEIWTVSYCDNCFDVKDENTVISYNLSHATRRFLHEKKDLENCIKEYQNNSSCVCEKCSHKFNVLSDFFNTLAEDTDGKLCMDIIDMMNITSNAWADHGCTRVYRVSYDVYILLGCVLLVTILFYVLAIVSQDAQDTELMRIHTIQSAVFDDVSVEQENKEESCSSRIDHSHSVSFK